MTDRYIQREISWNAFNARVLNEGLRSDVGLLDRLKFMAITSSNYDEFFMVRVARLMRDVNEGDHAFPPVGERPSKVLGDLLKEIREVVARQDHAMTEEIIPGLAKEGLVIVSPDQWGDDENAKADRVFDNELFPICSPRILSGTNPMVGQLSQGRLYAGYSLDDESIVFVRMPDNLNRFRDLRRSGEKREFLLLEDILLHRGEKFVPGRTITSRCLFRVTRDADMTVDEERDEDFIAAMEEVLESRKTSFPVRLESVGDRGLAERIREEINLQPDHHFHVGRPLNLKGFFALAGLPGFDHLRARSPSPKVPEDLGDNEDIWEVLKDRDILLHHPYESYAPVVRMVENAASDPKTLAIKMTLYRTSGDSPIVASLIRAAERGIQVTVLVELKARFDEGANINWAARLEKAGAIVIYGLAVLKVHAKALMVVRREESGIRRYLHLGTGNYNDSTAKLYTDMGLMTSRDEFTRDAALVFNAITGYSAEPRLKTLLMAPFSVRRETLQLIRREIERAKNGEEARIIAKMNSLVDPEIIDLLYKASRAGVRIDLNVRGICCLKPQEKGLSENIRVVSIIDGYLEHTRAFSYHNGGNGEVYLSSADWMTRNLDRRVELLFPVPNPAHRRRINRILEAYFRDNTRSWELGADGLWQMNEPKKRERRYRVQEALADMAARRAAEREDAERRALTVRRKAPGN